MDQDFYSNIKLADFIERDANKHQEKKQPNKQKTQNHTEPGFGGFDYILWLIPLSKILATSRHCIPMSLACIY